MQQLNVERETIRAVNRTIREFADDPCIPDESEWEFFCECGCFQLVELTVAAFDETGEVWAPGHGREV